jgi:hypothetical protein
MPRPNYKKLVESYNEHPNDVKKMLRESMSQKAIDPRDFDFGRLFEECFGWEEFRSCRSDPNRLVNAHVFEAAGAVNTSAFKDISGQIIYQMTLDAYQNEDFVFTKMIPERVSNLTYEKVAGITPIGPGNDDEWIVNETEDYQVAGVGQDWIHLPETKKRGKIVPLTREAIFFDRTNKVQERCSEIGYWLGYNNEQRAIDCVIDENGGAKSASMGGHRYHWRDTSYATYGDTPWDNLATSNALVDWTDLNTLEQLLNEIVDPNTGAPYVTDFNTLIVTKSLEHTANRIVNATEITVVTPGYATSANPNVTKMANPYSGLTVMTSKLLAQRMATDTDWLLGNPAKAFINVVNFPFQTRQSPPNSEDEFKRDIVMQWRADMRNAFGTLNPRYMAKSRA